MPGKRRCQVLLTRIPRKVLAKVPADLRSRLLAALHSLELDPLPNGVKKLAGFEDYYRIRVGDWRIIYALEEERLVVLVLEIGARGGVYRGY
jgi:mRNA interferase RelE/StbE